MCYTVNVEHSTSPYSYPPHTPDAAVAPHTLTHTHTWWKQLHLTLPPVLSPPTHTYQSSSSSFFSNASLAFLVCCAGAAILLEPCTLGVTAGSCCEDLKAGTGAAGAAGRVSFCITAFLDTSFLGLSRTLPVSRLACRPLMAVLVLVSGLKYSQRGPAVVNGATGAAAARGAVSGCCSTTCPQGRCSVTTLSECGLGRRAARQEKEHT